VKQNLTALSEQYAMQKKDVPGVQNVTGSAKNKKAIPVLAEWLSILFGQTHHGFAGAGAGVGFGVVAGAEVPSSALRVEIVSIPPSPDCVLIAVAARQRTTKTEARVHVAFSKKSVVLRTPIT
jgi:hypothetical protein